MKSTVASGSIGLFGLALGLLAVFFVFVIIPMLVAHQIAAWAYPSPQSRSRAGDLIVLMDKREALASKIFLGMMAILGICLWFAA